MACNENIIKNMASEVTRNCQGYNVVVDEDFVTFLIELLLLNPKYGKLFLNTINRDNLEFFVNECVAMLTKSETYMHTLKMQFIMRTNYGRLEELVDQHLDSIESCLRSLVMEIVEEEPEPDEDAAHKKLFRKISIYIILASGLGNPALIQTLKEGVAALESVFKMEDLKVFTALPTTDKWQRLHELLEIVSGVRLFNRDCKKGGEGISDLPFNLVDAGKASMSTLSNTLITVMQKVNTLTTAVVGCVTVQEETGNVGVKVEPLFTIEDYNQIFELLAFYRQYEIYTRRLLSDIELLVNSATQSVEKVRVVLLELHSSVKYKAAVPVQTVFPLFTNLWRVWRDMQNMTYLVSTITRLATNLASVQDLVKMPTNTLDSMLADRRVLTDQERLKSAKIEERLSLGSLKNYAVASGFNVLKDKNTQFLGFCTICLSVGALIPGNVKLGHITCEGKKYGFCDVEMARHFSKDPQRYINEVLEYARNNPHTIYLLGISEDVEKVKEVDTLVTKHVPKTKVCNKDIQTETHPMESYIEKDYTSDLWEWKRRACQWASIVNCRTHSTQTEHSHMRSEIQCQTVEQRDVSLQTKKDCGVNTNLKNAFIWGLRGQPGDGQHVVYLEEAPHVEKKEEAIDKCITMKSHVATYDYDIFDKVKQLKTEAVTPMTCTKIEAPNYANI